MLQALGQQLIALGVGKSIARSTLRPLELVQRRVSQEHVAVLNQLRHEAEEQGQKQRGNVLAVNVGIGHEHDLVVAQLLDIEFLVDAGTQRGNNRLDLGILEDLIHAGLLHVQDLAAQRQDGLEHGIAAALSGATCGVTLHDVELGNLRILRAAIRELAWQAAEVGGGFAAHHLAGLAGSHASMRGGNSLIDNGLSLCRVGIEPVIDVLVDRALDKALDLGIAQLGLGLALELRIAHLDGNDSRQAFAAVITGEVAVLFLDELMLLGIAVHQGGQGRTEALFVRATLVGVDGISKGVNGLLIALVPLQRYLYLVILALRIEGNDGRVDRGLGLIKELDVIGQSLWIVEGNLLAAFLFCRSFLCLAGFFIEGIAGVWGIVERGFIRAGFAGFCIGDFFQLDLLFGDALINELNAQALIQEGHFLQAARNGVVIVLGSFKNFRVRPETDLGARAAGIATLNELVRDGVLEVLVPVLAVALNLRLHAGRKRVHHGNADAVQAAGNGVGVGVELTAGVQLGHDHLDGRCTRGVHFYRNATAIIDDLDAAIFQQLDGNLVGVTGHGLINGVINDLPNEVVQAARTGRTNVHAGALTDGLEALQDRN